MILYVDTSALVPLLIDEPASEACGELWDSADSVTVTRLAYIEAVAALAMAERMGRISTEGVNDGCVVLDELWQAVDVIELVRRPVTLALRASSRACDGKAPE